MSGIAYGVGVGPGDPELITQKAVRIIRENPVIAVPGTTVETSLAYQIAAAAVPELAQKELVPIHMPMTKDPEALRLAHQNGADRLETYLAQGINVVYLTIGDPTIYSSFVYLQRILETDGYPVELVSGVPSFCAAAARLNRPLAEGDTPLHIIPGGAFTAEAAAWPGSHVLMKPGRKLPEIRTLLAETLRSVGMVAHCGMDSERIYRSLEEIPEQTGYRSLMIVT